ncbi:hypothetical protein GBAR_LOCUS2784 [Geodia barretti]|uniref:Uncharacterized protein n=1 Tax=Geodia barretti TaxID=519541 RepID=A0AA35R143_GEOBA|nr:hypothetical protein GBAR_LOCUS2784 [Geodia barretti]
MFTASPEVNGTILRCVVVNFDLPSDSPEPLEFTIIIQDISHYLVTIINMEDHHSVLTVNTTDTEYLLQSQDCQLSDYQVEIAAVNVVGVGDKYTSPPLTLDVVTVSNTATVIIDGNTPEISFQLQFRGNCNKETSFDFDLMPTFTQQLISISVTSQQFQPTLTLQSGDIQLNELYDVTLTVDGTSTFKLSLSTFDVQNVEVRLTNTEYEITCYFASGSEARGCRIVLTNNQGEEGKNAMHKDWRGLPELTLISFAPSSELVVALVVGTLSMVALIAVTSLVVLIFTRKCIGRKTAAESVSARGVRNNQFTMDNNPVYVVHKHPQSGSLTEQQQQQQQQQQQESEFDMDHNPLYMLHTRPQHKNNPSGDHEYETVEPLLDICLELLFSQTFNKNFGIPFTIFSVFRGVRNNQFTMDHNPVYMVHKHPQSVSLTEQQQQQQESEFDMDHNPLYMLHTRPQHKNNPSGDHEYETVQPLP